MSRAVAYAMLTGAVVFWGASFVATKVLLRELSPALLVTARFAIGTALLAVALVWRGSLRPLPRKELGAVILLGFLGITLHQWLQATALLTTEASISSWIVATTPIFVAILGWAVLHERLSLWRAAGILVAAVGMAVVVSRGGVRGFLAGGAWQVGDALILLSAVNWAVFTVLSKRLMDRREADHPPRDRPILLMFYVLAFGLILCLPWLAAEGAKAEWPLSPESWWALAILGLACSGLAYLFWYAALDVIDATQVGAFLYLEPVVTSVVALPVLGEPISASLLIGGATIVAGLWLVNRGWPR
ncbi:MAG TPA: DMT family transporter [Anaerolineales bacterium]|nr:DMT family transporter [Anaerolineales bacterium]